ncbi:hypothetical protein [Bartonella quintana]|uniref:hypothetical protein n=1 Tax=Bartonella quintana TaxID=803 RepID=UPI000DA36A4D|nr:beta-hexosaminidase [Bartonella quintana]
MCELSQSNEGLGSNKHQGIAIISEIKAMITGFFLREDEKTFIVEHKPWAFILFVRNIVSEDDVKVLTISLRDVSGRDSILFLLIRRGGEVQYLLPLPSLTLVAHYPSAALWGKFIKKIKIREFVLHGLCLDFMLFDLMKFGINANCLPVLDVPDGAHDIIGTRAYGQEQETVAALGRAAAAQGLVLGWRYFTGDEKLFPDMDERFAVRILN